MISNLLKQFKFPIDAKNIKIIKLKLCSIFFYNLRFKQRGGCLIARMLVDPCSSFLFHPMGCTQIYYFLKSHQVCDVPDMPEFAQGEYKYLGRTEGNTSWPGLARHPTFAKHLHWKLYFVQIFQKNFPVGKLPPFWIETTEEIPIGIFRI